MIDFVVPAAAETGGIQAFALTQIQFLGDLAPRVVDWPPDVERRGPRAFTRVMPPRIAWRAARRRALESDLQHYWHVAPAVGQDLRRAVVTCHGSELLPANSRRVRRALVQRALHEAAAVTADSTFTAGLVGDLCERPDLEIVSPGVEVDTYVYRASVQSHRLTVGTLSRLVPRKNVLTIVSALAELQAAGIDVHYRLAGDGPERDSILRRLAQCRLSHEYLGPISEEMKRRDFLPSLDVFVLPTLPLDSDIEGFGIVYLEAASCGVPVVASASGGTTDAVASGVSGVLADPRDGASVAAAIRSAFALRREDCRTWASAHTAARVAAQFRAVYERLLENCEDRPIRSFS